LSLTRLRHHIHNDLNNNATIKTCLPPGPAALHCDEQKHTNHESKKGGNGMNPFDLSKSFGNGK